MSCFDDVFDANGMRPTDYMLPWIEFDHAVAIKKYSKYGAVRIEGFDSVSEYVRYQILKSREAKGFISNLKCQVEYVFPGRTYIPDFTYRNDTGFIVEDVKSPRLKYTARFKEAEKLMKERYGIIIKIVSPKNLTTY